MLLPELVLLFLPPKFIHHQFPRNTLAQDFVSTEAKQHMKKHFLGFTCWPGYIASRQDLYHFSWYYACFLWESFPQAESWWLRFTIQNLQNGHISWIVSSIFQKIFSSYMKKTEFSTQLLAFQTYKFTYSCHMKSITLKPEESQGFHFHREKTSFVAIHNLYEMTKQWNCKTSCKIYCCNFCRSTTPCDNEATSSSFFFFFKQPGVWTLSWRHQLWIGTISPCTRIHKVKYQSMWTWVECSVLPPVYLSCLFQASSQPS